MPTNKTRITILIDSDVLTFFKARAARRGAEPYQTQINRLLRQYVAGIEPWVGGSLAGVAEPAARYRAAREVARGKGKTTLSPRRGLQHTVKAVVRPGEKLGWVARCVELPVATQGTTLDEVARNLREAVGLHLEGEDPGTFGLVPEPCLLLALELPAARAATSPRVKSGRVRGGERARQLPG